MTEMPKYPDRNLRAHEAAEMAGVSVPTLYRLVKAETFPQPNRPMPGTSRWLTSEVLAWMHGLSANNDAARVDPSAVAREKLAANRADGRSLGNNLGTVPKRKPAAA